jgi:hypothetical protein
MSATKTTRQFTTAELRAYIQGRYGLNGAPAVVAQVNEWLARGDGVAVYENVLVGDPDRGRPQLVSYGSTAAFLVTLVPPEVMPPKANWRYALAGTYRGAPLPE